ncbi:enoyl-CoA hydratase/isomerase family protein [Derxia gummosa]|uniref:3-hydroxyisobutyryl-CoA hydrolase n=1 Tax=Derxia gummosa DSM 723 TaxID=1121388 RepID=A0A8B6X875_9BURK|nr:enoyl-CoA hydratase/isomerase family protein [Derxia gummosa]
MTDPIRAERHGPLGILVLDRPAALNSLTLDMVRALHRQLDIWSHDDNVQAVLLRGEGGKAFCAGGDVRAVRDWTLAGGDAAHTFFVEEYALDLAIHRYAKPVICWMDGITMGGGMGLAQGAGLRIATPSTRVAMPETAIGYFPDVGGSWFLSRLPGALGVWLAMTGQTLAGADAVVAGLADCLATDTDLPALVALLAARPWGREPAVTLLGEIAARLGPTAASFDQDAPASARTGVAHASDVTDADAARAAMAPAERSGGASVTLPGQLALIDRHFGQPDVASILASLAADRGDWARDTLAVLRSRSPFAVRIAFELIRRGRRLPLEACFAMELALDDAWLPRGDFCEGVRALLVDKDRNPRWRHSRIEEVSEDEVQAMFAGTA